MTRATDALSKTPRTWTVKLTDKDRVWLRAMMYALQHGLGISGTDRARAREFETPLAPRSLEKRSKT